MSRSKLDAERALEGGVEEALRACGGDPTELLEQVWGYIDGQAEALAEGGPGLSNDERRRLGALVEGKRLLREAVRQVRFAFAAAPSSSSSSQEVDSADEARQNVIDAGGF
jgi:hypothetical protein